MSRNTWYAVLTLSLLFSTAVWNVTAQETKPAFHWPEGKRVAVSLSFDNGRASQVDTGLDVINPTGVKVTFFVNPPAVKEHLNGWKRAVASGHEIGSHSVTHPCTGNFPWSAKNALEDYTLDRMSRQLERCQRADSGAARRPPHYLRLSLRPEVCRPRTADEELHPADRPEVSGGARVHG